MKNCSLRTTARSLYMTVAACAFAVLPVHAQAQAQNQDQPRNFPELTIDLGSPQTTAPAPTESSTEARSDLPPCQFASTYSVPGFDAAEWIAQGGFAENEILAASYSVSPSQFPLRLDLLECLFLTSQTQVTTTTEYTVFVWEGDPATGNLIFQASTSTGDLPSLVMQPGDNATLIQVSVDPSSEDQIIIQNSAAGVFSIGLRIDQHNNQVFNPCVIPPASQSNAFPATDAVGGVEALQDNWINVVSCPGVPAGWYRFSELGVFGLQPSGDWALAATWTSLSCNPSFGACCFPDGFCDQMGEDMCISEGGSWAGAGSSCESQICESTTQACCFDSGGCLDLPLADCVGAGGFAGGFGTSCRTFNCNPQGACCLPDGSCADGLSPAECAAMNGVYQGDDTVCSAINCPPPLGACCFGTGFCLELSEADCLTGEGSWAGPLTDCLTGCLQGCGPADLFPVDAPDALLDSDDVLQFVSFFNASDARADLFPSPEGDGAFNSDDVLFFVNEFNAGCE